MTHRIQQESIKRRLAKLAAPIFIETLLIMMLGAVDTIMLSRHSDNSVAAVGVVNQKKFTKTLHKWHSIGAIVEGELS